MRNKYPDGRSSAPNAQGVLIEGACVSGEPWGNHGYPCASGSFSISGPNLNAASGDFAVFALDPRLQQDTLLLGDFPLCRLLLCNDANYPWFILVPRQAAVSEVFDLDAAQQRQLWEETEVLARFVKSSFAADKINIASLGNVVSQLHMHVIARFTSDAAWPAPVWGKHAALAYPADQLAEIRSRLQPLLTHGLQLAGAAQ